jgi:myo-inositol-1(or 4)-monophosphatase
MDHQREAADGASGEAASRAADRREAADGASGEAASRAAVAEAAARAGADVAIEAFRSEMTVETKDDPTDVVTETDRAAQATVVDRLRESFPDDPVVGEEAAEETVASVPDEGAAWVVDPIDGTTNFVRGLRTWATSVAAVRDGDPVAGATVMPALGDAYVATGDGAFMNGEPVAVSEVSDPGACVVTPTIWWDGDRREEYARACRALVERFGDVRRFGCSQATLAAVASGALEGAITNVRAHPWDTMTGACLIERAGGRVTDLAGDRWRHDATGLVASNGAVHDDLLAAAREISPG